MITVEDWAEIRRLHRAEKLSIKAIARKLGVARNTVRAAIRADGPPRYSRPAKGSLVDAVEPQIREQLRLDPTMPATVIAERIGWIRSITILKDRVRQIRPEYRGVDPADRIVYQAGDTVQCDLWFPGKDLIPGAGGRDLPVLVMTSMFAKFTGARLLPSRRGGDLTAGMWEIVREDFGAVPRRLWWDRESAIAKTGTPTALAGALAGTLGTTLVIARAADPEFKGGVERRNRYLETSFLPGRSFTSPFDFDVQLREWLAAVASQRKPRLLGGRTVAEVFVEDKAAMMTLPPVAPAVGLTGRVRLPRDYYLRVDTNDYSVDPRFIGRFLDVHADLAQVTVRHEGRIITSHDRSWGLRGILTDPEHVRTAGDLRRAYASDRDLAGRQHSARDAGQQVPRRSLTDYDRYATTARSPPRPSRTASWTPAPTVPGRVPGWRSSDEHD